MNPHRWWEENFYVLNKIETLRYLQVRAPNVSPKRHHNRAACLGRLTQFAMRSNAKYGDANNDKELVGIWKWSACDSVGIFEQHEDWRWSRIIERNIPTWTTTRRL